MKRALTVLLLGLLVTPALSCGREKPLRASSRKEIVVRSRPLDRDATFTILGLRREDRRDDRQTGWDSTFRDEITGTEEGFVRRDFTLSIANRTDQPWEFRATIEYRDHEGNLVRKRVLRKLLVPPFTEKSYSGYTLFRSPGEVQVKSLVHRIDDDDSFADPDGSTTSPAIPQPDGFSRQPEAPKP
ncbi:MAG: hypothetical protein WBX15_16315 [Thermoanaerobaculia bacterium]